ncbi:MAG: ABC transporter permease [Pseudonocardiaceae bacterium]
MTLLGTQIRETWFHLRLLLRNSYFMQLALTTPLVFLLLRRLASAHTADPTAWMDACTVGMWSTTATAVGLIGFQRFEGTLEHLVMTPRPLSTVLAPMVSACSLLGFVGLPLVIALSYFLDLPIRIEHPMWWACGVLLLTIACASCAFCLSGLFVITRHALVYEPVLIAPAMLLTGVAIAYDRLPLFGKVAGFAFPVTGAVQLLHHGVGAADNGSAIGWAVQSLLAAAAFVLSARVLLRFAESKARQDATLALS